MIKWFVYIVVLLICAPCLSSAKTKNKNFIAFYRKLEIGLPGIAVDTVKNIKKQEQEKIKEVAKAKKQPKPEKIEPAENNQDAAKPKPRPKRQRRPEGMERPPEIPRRNGN